VVITAAEILAVTELFKFAFDSEYLTSVGSEETSIRWGSTLGVNPAVWVGIFLIIVLCVNLLPVRQYGRIEYICGCAKIMMLVLLIMYNIIVNARQRYHESRFWTYQTPWGFSTQNMTSGGHVLTGDLGKFTAFWTAMTTTIFSLLGMEIILFTAAENMDLQRTETIKLSSRKISLRVILLYALATFTVGLNVPFSDENLKNLTINGVTGGQNSAFVIAAVREHTKGLPHFLNGFFIFSATSTGANALYSASRTLHAMASIPDAWPSWKPFEAVRSRLERTKYGVPMNAVLLSWLVAFLAFLSVSTEATEVRHSLKCVLFDYS
jgi:amino acid transporter